jgi:hypothetical protein
MDAVANPPYGANLEVKVAKESAIAFSRRRIGPAALYRDNAMFVGRIR